MIRPIKPLFLRNTMFPSGGFGYGVSSETAREKEEAIYQMSQGGDYGMAYRAGYTTAAQVLEAVNSGKLDPYTAQLYLTSGKNGYMNMSEEQEKYFNNLLARYQSQNALMWQAEQLQALGLSNSGVLSTGAAHTAQDMSNVRTQKANRAANIATSMINMASRMGAAGIHGTALNLVKNAAGQAATTLAHSASNSLSRSPKMSAKEEAEFWNFWENR